MRYDFLHSLPRSLLLNEPFLRCSGYRHSATGCVSLKNFKINHRWIHIEEASLNE